MAGETKTRQGRKEGKAERWKGMIGREEGVSRLLREEKEKRRELESRK